MQKDTEKRKRSIGKKVPFPRKRLKPASEADLEKPAYVVTIPTVVADNSEGESSGDEDPYSDSFSIKHYRQPTKYFRLSPKSNKKCRGIIPVITHRPAFSIPSSPEDSTVAKLTKQFEAEAFLPKGRRSDFKDCWAQKQTEKRLGLSLVLNRMRSLSTRNNNCLIKELNSVADSKVSVKRAGILWDGVWEEYDDVSEIWNIVPYERVRQFYKKLKTKKPRLARRFRRQVEKGKNKYSQVPFRELREFVRKDAGTKALVQQFRTKKRDRPVYFGVFDSDIASLGGNFRQYDRMIADHQRKEGVPLDIASGGYLIPDVHPRTGRANPIAALAVYIDLLIRQKTAEKFPNGVYYPEPNSIVRILPGHNTVEVGFSNGEKHYLSPDEMRIFKDNIIKKREIDPRLSMRFDSRAAIETIPPSRMLNDFQAYMNNAGSIVRWTLKEMNKMRNVSQSHFKLNVWLNNLLHDIDVPRERTLIINGARIEIKSRATMRQLLKSAIGRLYQHYDPIKIAARIVEQLDEKHGFQQTFIDTLKSYDPLQQPLPANSKERSHEKRTAGVASVWNHLDGLTDLNALKVFVANLLDADDLTRIEYAVTRANQGVVNILKRRLCLNFNELSCHLFEDYFSELLRVSSENIPSVRLPALPQAILDNVLVRDDGGQFRMDRTWYKKIPEFETCDEHLDNFGAFPLHWAAITGNKMVITRLNGIKTPQWISDIHLMATGPGGEDNNCKVLPLHCAIKYCADNGADVELIRLLLDEKTAVAKTIDDRAPLIMAIEEIENVLPTLALFRQYEFFTQEHYQVLSNIVSEIPFTERQGILAHAIHRLPKSKMPYTFIEMLIEQGADPNAAAFIPALANTTEFDPDRCTHPLFLAIANGDMQLVQLLIAEGAKVKDVYDHLGRPPILSAMHELKINALPMIKLLVENGADVNECDLYDGTLPLHESISPLDERYLGMNSDTDKYIQGFDRFLMQTGLLGEERYTEYQQTRIPAPVLAYLLGCEGIDINASDGAPLTALSVAIEASAPLAAAALLSRGADLSVLEESEKQILQQWELIDAGSESDDHNEAAYDAFANYISEEVPTLGKLLESTRDPETVISRETFVEIFGSMGDFENFVPDVFGGGLFFEADVESGSSDLRPPTYTDPEDPYSWRSDDEVNDPCDQDVDAEEIDYPSKPKSDDDAGFNEKLERRFFWESSDSEEQDEEDALPSLSDEDDDEQSMTDIFSG